MEMGKRPTTVGFQAKTRNSSQIRLLSPPSSPRHDWSSSSSIISYKDVNERKVKSASTVERVRTLIPDDCCNFCELYQNGSLTGLKHQEIDEWRHNVSLSTKLNQKDYYTTMSINSRRTTYPNYKPPGIPDDEPGFRKLKVPKGMKVPNPSPKSVKIKPENKYATGTDPNSSDMRSVKSVTSVSEYNMHHTILKEDKGSLNKKLSTSMDSLASANTDISKTESDHACSRSNQLLNVLTIDDYKYRYNGQAFSEVVKEPHGWSDMSHIPNHDIASVSFEPAPHAKQKETNKTDFETEIEATSNIDGVSFQGNNKQSFTPGEDLISNRMTNHNVSISSLNGQQNNYPKSKPKKEPGKPSRRFRKLHSNLHIWMEDEIFQPHQQQLLRRGKVPNNFSDSIQENRNQKQVLQSQSYSDNNPKAYETSETDTLVSEEQIDSSNLLSMLINMDKNKQQREELDESHDQERQSKTKQSGEVK